MMVFTNGVGVLVEVGVEVLVGVPVKVEVEVGVDVAVKIEMVAPFKGNPLNCTAPVALVPVAPVSVVV